MATRSNDFYEGYDLSITAGRNLEFARASTWRNNGVLALTAEQLYYIRERGNSYVENAIPRNQITGVTFDPKSRSQELTFSVKGNSRVFYPDEDDDLMPIALGLCADLQQNIERTRTKRTDRTKITSPFNGYDLSVISGNIQHVAPARVTLNSGLLVLTNDHLIFLRQRRGKSEIYKFIPRIHITGVNFDPVKDRGDLQIRVNQDDQGLTSENGEDLSQFALGLSVSLESNIDNPFSARDRQVAALVMAEPIGIVKAGTRMQTGLLVTTPENLFYVRPRRSEFEIAGAFARALITDVKHDTSSNSGRLQFRYDGSSQTFRHKGDDLSPIADEIRNRAGAQWDGESADFLDEPGSLEPSADAALPPADKSLADELKELTDLKDAGLITQEDLDAKKSQLLGL